MAEKSSHMQSIIFSSIFYFYLHLSSISRSAFGYKNYTVGDSLGWYDNTQKLNVDYQKWASNKNFSLGDFLVFHTDNNHSVVETYNVSTYNSCDYNDALDGDTTQWSTEEPSNTAIHPVTIAVPLLKEGNAYFFSGDYDGEQCLNGQRFQINVTHGQGLPETLKSPADDSLSPNSNAPDVGDDDLPAPDTSVLTNFSYPDTGRPGGETSGSNALYLNFVHFKLAVEAMLRLVAIILCL